MEPRGIAEGVPLGKVGRVEKNEKYPTTSVFLLLYHTFVSACIRQIKHMVLERIYRIRRYILLAFVALTNVNKAYEFQGNFVGKKVN